MTGNADGNQTGGAPVPDVGWEVDAPNAYRWTAEAYDLLVAGKLDAAVTIRAGVTTASANGECPRCHHQFQWSQVLDAVVFETVRTLGVDQTDTTGYIGLTVACQCTEDHSGRPTSVTEGCGINFRVEVHARGSGS